VLGKATGRRLLLAGARTTAPNHKTVSGHGGAPRVPAVEEALVLKRTRKNRVLRAVVRTLFGRRFPRRSAPNRTDAAPPLPRTEVAQRVGTSSGQTLPGQIEPDQEVTPTTVFSGGSPYLDQTPFKATW
jgi:hypothetical protein